MKTSKKLLLSVAGLIIAILIIFVAILRDTVQSIQLRTEIKRNYRTVSVDDFERLDFSSHWIVRVKQGKECKVELTAEDDSVFRGGLKNINGTLYFKVDSAMAKNNTDSIYVRITMPSLRVIKAVRGTKIHLESFQSDSLRVILENGCEFTGNNNSIKHASFKTSGEVTLQFTSTF